MCTGPDRQGSSLRLCRLDVLPAAAYPESRTSSGMRHFVSAGSGLRFGASVTVNVPCSSTAIAIVKSLSGPIGGVSQSTENLSLEENAWPWTEDTTPWLAGTGHLVRIRPLESTSITDSVTRASTRQRARHQRLHEPVYSGPQAPWYTRADTPVGSDRFPGQKSNGRPFSTGCLQSVAATCSVRFTFRRAEFHSRACRRKSP